MVNDVTGWSFPLFHSTNIHNHEMFPAPNDDDHDEKKTCVFKIMIAMVNYDSWWSRWREYFCTFDDNRDVVKTDDDDDNDGLDNDDDDNNANDEDDEKSWGGEAEERKVERGNCSRERFPTVQLR